MSQINVTIGKQIEVNKSFFTSKNQIFSILYENSWWFYHCIHLWNVGQSIIGQFFLYGIYRIMKFLRGWGKVALPLFTGRNAGDLDWRWH